MSIKRVKQVNRGPRRDDFSGPSFLGSKPPDRVWSWADDVASLPDDSFVAYSMTASFSKGTFINHAKFGKGVVTNVEGPNIDVLFEEGPKRLRHMPTPSTGGSSFGGR